MGKQYTNDKEHILVCLSSAPSNVKIIQTAAAMEYARLSGVTKIVIGRTVIGKRKFIGKPTLTEKLISLAPDVDIHIIPDSDAVMAKGKKRLFEKPHFVKTFKELTVSTVLLLLSTFFYFRNCILQIRISLRFICLAF